MKTRGASISIAIAKAEEIERDDLRYYIHLLRTSCFSKQGKYALILFTRRKRTMRLSMRSPRKHINTIIRLLKMPRVHAEVSVILDPL